MSSPLALAAVTHVLKDLLNEGIVNSVLAGNVRVTAQPPIRDPQPSTAEQSQLNVFLYQATPNSGWRNQGLPAFDAGGTRTGNPPLALDLHYLITAYDQRDLHAEVLLGYAMHLLHENPVLSRRLIRRSLTADLPEATPPQSSLPPELRALTQSGLADQIEAIKITPQPLNAEEMSKLWTGFQAPYRPSAAYLITVVLIESRRAARSAPPVLRVGEDARGPRAQPNLLSPFPTLVAWRAPGYQPVAQPGGVVHLFGYHLEGTNAEVILRHAGLDLVLTVPTVALTYTPVPRPEELGQAGDTFELTDEVFQLADRRVQVDLSQAVDRSLTPPAANWAAGLYTLELRVLRPGDTQARSTNALPLAMAPAMVLGPPNPPVVTAAAPEDQWRATVVRLRCLPDVRQGQRVSLVLGDRELAGQPVFAGGAARSDTLEFRGPLPEAMFAPVGVPPAPPSQPARLRVDGVESVFIRRFPPPRPPEFDLAQVIPMP